MAYLEDTGWYRTDYSQATATAWGNQEGCDFISKGDSRVCDNWGQLPAVQAVADYKGVAGYPPAAAVSGYCPSRPGAVKRPSRVPD